MRPALAIAAKDLRLRLRDRSALIVAFVAPIVLATIISATFGSDTVGSFQATYALVDLDGSSLSEAFAEEVLGSPELSENLTVRPVGTSAEARALIERDEADAAFIFPEGFEAEIMGGGTAKVRVLKSSGSTVAAPVAESLAAAFTDQVSASRLSVLTSLEAGAAPAAVPDLAERAAAERIPVVLTDAGIGGQDVTGANYFGPAMAIFFLYFTVGFGARSFLEERRTGTLDRLLASPAGGGSVFLGKTGAIVVLALVSFLTLFAFMSLVFGTSWGDPLAVLLLSLVTVLAVLGVTGAAGALARTDQQVETYGQVVAVTFALIGGNFFPVQQLPDVMQKISLLTPNGWALRGFQDLVYEGGGVVSILPNVAAIGAFAVVTGALAFVAGRRMVAA